MEIVLFSLLNSFGPSRHRNENDREAAESSEWSGVVLEKSQYC